MAKLHITGTNAAPKFGNLIEGDGTFTFYNSTKADLSYNFDSVDYTASTDTDFSVTVATAGTNKDIVIGNTAATKITFTLKKSGNH